MRLKHRSKYPAGGSMKTKPVVRLHFSKCGVGRNFVKKNKMIRLSNIRGVLWPALIRLRRLGGFSSVRALINKQTCRLVKSTWTLVKVNNASMLEEPNSYERSTIINLIKRYLPNVNVSKVMKVNNPYLKAMYDLVKEEYKSRAGTLQEMELFHATNQSAVASIVTNNLDWRLVCRSRFGRGNCFSSDADYANCHSNRRNGGGPRKEIKDDPVTEQKMDPTYYVTHTSPVKRKVLGDINNTADSPISPTANLKLLTKVASQCDSIENSGVSIASFYSVNGTPPTSELVKSESRNLNSDLQVKGVRKFKSLGFLCDKFLQLYPLDVPEHSHSRILLSDLANLLGVEKRRIYDIINVVESLQMATKVGKNSYMWTGHKKLADTLNQLKVYAKQVGLMQFVRRQQLNRKLYLNLHQGEVESEESCAFVENSNIASFFRNERRIGVLCQKFVMLFLVSLKDGLINLDLAAQALVGEDCQQNKTRLRRLYDIANILVSLGIIAKLDLGGSWKKPVFRYVGPLLLQLEDFSSESPILSSLVKAELSSDGVSSDFSEDGNDLSWKHQVIHSSTKSAEIDHSYSMDLTKNGVKPIAVVEPAAKKRLVFSTDSLNKVPFKVKAEQIALPTQETSTVNTTPTVLRVLGQGSVPQPITNGGVYKAVRVGNDIQLIRIDDC